MRIKSQKELQKNQLFSKTQNVGQQISGYPNKCYPKMFTSFLKLGFILSCFLSYSFEKEFARNFCSKKSIPPGKILVKVWYKNMGLIR